jgi:hypothetical protein
MRKGKEEVKEEEEEDDNNNNNNNFRNINIKNLSLKIRCPYNNNNNFVPENMM